MQRFVVLGFRRSRGLRIFRTRALGRPSELSAYILELAKSS